MIKNVISIGFRRAMIGWRLLLPLAVVSIGFGLLSLWPLFGSAGASALQRPFTRQLATNLDSLTLVQFMLSLNADQASSVVGLWLLGLLSLLLLNGLAYNFCAGGILSSYAGQRGFWAGARHFFWTFSGLGFLAVVLFMLLASGGIMAAQAIGASLSTTLITIVLIGQVLNVVFEYARAAAVARDLRGPAKALETAVSFCGRHFGGVVALALLGNLLLVVWVTLYVLVAGWLQPLALVGAAVLWQQLFVIGQQWIKLLRLAWAVTYIQQREERSTVEPSLQPAADDPKPSVAP